MAIIKNECDIGVKSGNDTELTQKEENKATKDKESNQSTFPKPGGSEQKKLDDEREERRFVGMAIKKKSFVCISVVRPSSPMSWYESYGWWLPTNILPLQKADRRNKNEKQDRIWNDSVCKEIVFPLVKSRATQDFRRVTRADLVVARWTREPKPYDAGIERTIKDLLKSS